MLQFTLFDSKWHADVIFEHMIPRTPDELFHPKRVKVMCRIIHKYVKAAKCTNKIGLDEFSYDLSQEKTCSFSTFSLDFQVDLFNCLSATLGPL
jgi:hypothetical protein